MSNPETQAGTLTKSEREELAALRAAQVQREREEAGIATGRLACGTMGCSFTEKEAEMVGHVMERVNEETGIVENSVTQWLPINEDEANCPECEYPLTVIIPNAQSVFPRNYRWIYPKPVK